MDLILLLLLLASRPLSSSAEPSSLGPILLPGEQPGTPPPPAEPQEFALRYIFHHGTHAHPTLHRRLNVTSATVLRDDDGRVLLTDESGPRLRVRAEPLSIQRLADRSQANIDRIMDAGRARGSPLELDASAWTVAKVPGPNVTDKETVLSFARMAANAYVTDDDGTEWEDVGRGFNYTEHFGWLNDGLRGHIFADAKNQTVVIAMKGTSPAVFDGSGTTTNDKINDNLFFSCCCGQGGRYGWLQVCDCQTSAYTCNSTCVTEALRDKNRYYAAAQEIYGNVTALYPKANIWLAGHSLGGSTSSLVALTYGLPVVTFEAPGEAMAAKRLGLPTPPGYRLGAHQERVSTGGFHFGHNADPIFMGTCNTYSSVCTIAGYAMESVCHSGQTCVYDTIGDLGWRVGAGTHKIRYVISDVLEKYPEPARCVPMVDCQDCFNWKFYESNHSDTTTTSLATTTTYMTITSTCKTPGWWGCNDPTTGITDPTTTTTTTATTTTCKTPGWFGCYDTTEVPEPPVTSETTTTDATTTTTCLTPGWFGCYDTTDDPEPPTTSAPKKTPTHTSAISTTATPSCHTPGWFGCKDKTPTASPGDGPPAPTSPPSSSVPSPTAPVSCADRSWYGWCREWTGEDRQKLDL